MDIQGQFYLFDVAKENEKPCKYSFQRYIGQKVRHTADDKVHVIREIKEYYTVLEDNMIGTPYDISPVE